jgi:hypothetical protein
MEGHNALSGYVMIPGWLLARKPDANDLLVYATLASFGRFNTLAGCYEECRPALSTIAEQAGLSVSSVKRGIGNLLRLGAIERQQRHAEDGKTQLPSVYRVIFGAIVGPQEQGGFTGEPRRGSTGEQGGGSPVSREQEPPTQNHDTQKTADAEVNTAKLLGDWIDWLKAKGIETLPGQTKARYGRELKQALADGFTVPVIGKALQALYQRGKASNPQLLPHILIEVQATEPVSGPPRQQPKSFRQQDSEAADAETARMRIAQELIDGGMQPRAAYNRAKAMETNAGVPYIEGTFRDTTAREVTSDEAGSGQ